MNQGISILVVSVDDYTCGPAAAAMLSKKLKERFPEVECAIDSASHIPFHKGKSVDHRMCEALKQRGYTVSHVSRPLVFDDFVDYELMLSLGGSFKMDPEDYQGSRHVQPIAKYCSPSMYWFLAYCISFSWAAASAEPLAAASSR